MGTKNDEKDLKALTKEQMQSQAAQAIEESFDGVWDAMETAKAEYDEEDHEHKFKYKLGVALTMEPLGGDVKVSAKAVWSEKHEVLIEEVVVSANLDLFQVAEQKKANEELAAQVEQAKAIIAETKRASLSGIQRRLKVNADRAMAIMDRLEEAGIVGPPKEDGTREIIEG